MEYGALFVAPISPEKPRLSYPGDTFSAPKRTWSTVALGSITARKKADGSTSYKAQIRLKEKGVIVHSETETFTRRALEPACIKRREGDSRRVWGRWKTEGGQGRVGRLDAVCPVFASTKQRLRRASSRYAGTSSPKKSSQHCFSRTSMPPHLAVRAK